MVIVAAVDRSEWGRTVVAEAASLATAFGEPLHVVHATTEGAFDDLGRVGDEYVEPERNEDAIVAAAERVAAEAAEGVDVPTETVGLIGEPAAAIVGYASDNDARFLVVGPRKQSPAGKAVFGSVGQAVILDADVPVVSVLQR